MMIVPPPAQFLTSFVFWPRLLVQARLRQFQFPAFQSFGDWRLGSSARNVVIWVGVQVASGTCASSAFFGPACQSMFAKGELVVCLPWHIGMAVVRGPHWEYDMQDGDPMTMGDRKKKYNIGWVEVPDERILKDWLCSMIFGELGDGPAPTGGLFTNGMWLDRTVVATFPGTDKGRLCYKANADGCFDLYAIKSLSRMTDSERVAALGGVMEKIMFIITYSLPHEATRRNKTLDDVAVKALVEMTQTFVHQSIQTIMDGRVADVLKKKAIAL